MIKKIVKLTENDLHKIIKESVKNILSEIDWRTLDQAEKKAALDAERVRTAPEKRVRMYQANKFKKGKIKRQNELYDGVNSENYDNPINYPTSINSKPRKQMAGATHIAKYNDGRSKYQDGKWREQK